MRKGINEVHTRLYQRGKILTWPREDKVQLISDLSIGGIVNFWPKVDPEMSEMPIDWYWLLPAAESRMMLEPRMERAAGHVCEYLSKSSKSVLVLCEAGKTRSAFFCALVLRRMGLSTDDIFARLRDRVPGLELKGFMIDHLRERI